MRTILCQIQSIVQKRQENVEEKPAHADDESSLIFGAVSFYSKWNAAQRITLCRRIRN